MSRLLAKDSSAYVICMYFIKKAQIYRKVDLYLCFVCCDLTVCDIERQWWFYIYMRTAAAAVGRATERVSRLWYRVSMTLLYSCTQSQYKSTETSAAAAFRTPSRQGKLTELTTINCSYQYCYIIWFTSYKINLHRWSQPNSSLIIDLYSVIKL